ncbi:hypothetical protein [Aquamicrobium sp. LC103]|uniref:hypothetical protein n=1 Tax=Aquamicrobium sp. LC103 TaxID=1120658 RepID=UPI00063EBBD7|nr:hypothetical protein [Aquamicrobium sp. LC103]TKT74394.1 hypothetical protein XW59_023420 [Aquamicrobium sp. LC103]
MNVANLQLEGLLMAIAAVNQILVRKGVVDFKEIDVALSKVEAALTGDERVYEDMSPANRDAVCFPVRLLRMANNSQGDGNMPTFAELTRTVARTKEPYNDQM